MKILSIEFTANHIYLYEQECGRKEVTVEKKYRIEMPTNTYVNRMLINNDRRISDAIKNCIMENKIKTKKVVLTAPSTDCMIENMSILDGSKKQIAGMVEQELRKRHKLNADYLYDYVVLGPDPLKEGFLSIQVTLCIKAMIQNAYDVIKKAGLVPYKIIFVNHAMEELAKQYRLIDAAESNVIACINQDEAHFLYVGHGQEPYYRYSKLKTEQRTEENFFVLSNINQKPEESDYESMLEKKVSEDLTRMMRFHSQRYPGVDIANVYLYGCYDKLDNLAEYLENALSIPTRTLAMEREVQGVRYKVQDEEHAYNGIAATASLMQSGEFQYDFFGRLEETRGDDTDQMMFLPSLIAAGILIIVLLAAFITRADVNKLAKETDKLNAWIGSEEVQQAYAEKNQMIETCNAYTRYNNSVAESIDLLETMPRFESDDIRVIEELTPEGCVITGYNFKEGIMNLGCYGDDQYAPAEFAQILQESGNYKEVTYSGFQKYIGVFGEETYSFTITIKMW